jgi:drug/metabolite transporter (DMT)-like permease
VSESQTPTVVILSIATLLWVAYWARAFVGGPEALAFLVAATMIGLIGNLAAPPAWRRARDDKQAGVGLGLAAAALVALAHHARATRADLPFMDPEQLPVYLWWAAAACMIAAAWKLLGPAAEAPACAECGAAAAGPACARCGSAFA